MWRPNSPYGIFVVEKIGKLVNHVCSGIPVVCWENPDFLFPSPVQFVLNVILFWVIQPPNPAVSSHVLIMNHGLKPVSAFRLTNGPNGISWPMAHNKTHWLCFPLSFCTVYFFLAYVGFSRTTMTSEDYRGTSDGIISERVIQILVILVK